MGGFFKTLGKGVLYILTLPLLVVFLSIYFIISILSFFYLTVQGIFLFFKGESLIGEMVEDKMARQRLNQMNNIQEDENLEKYVIVENEKDQPKNIIEDTSNIATHINDNLINNVPQNEINTATIDPNNQPFMQTAYQGPITPEENIEIEPEPLLEPEPEEEIEIENPYLEEPLPEMEPIPEEEIQDESTIDIQPEEEIPFNNIEKESQKEPIIEESFSPVDEMLNKEKEIDTTANFDQILEDLKVEDEKPKKLFDKIKGNKTETIDLNEGSYFSQNKYIIDHEDENDDDDSGVDFYNYDGGKR